MGESNYEIKRGEDGKIVDVIVNGKPVKRGSMRGLRKAQETPLWKEYTENTIAINPFSGVEVELNPLEHSIYAFCMRWYQNYCNGRIFAPIQTYDDMKYFFMNLNPGAYYDLLD
jgi:hypothetical protein